MHPQQPLPQEPFILRLRNRLQGGAKSKEALVKKLQEHLQSKGVPKHLSHDRADQVFDILGLSAVQAAYDSLDPWKALKLAAGSKVRLVLPAELKEAKTAKPASRDSAGDDPWVTQGDPWQKGSSKTAGSKDQPSFALNLLPGYLLDPEGNELPVLRHISADACGVALLEIDELESLAKVDVLLSAEVLAAIVIGATSPAVGAWKAEPITFPAVHADGKVLLRSYLVNFGRKHAVVAPAQKSINMEFQEVAVVTIELRQEYVSDWAQAARNPLKYSFSVVDGLQQSLVANWSRRFFHGRREAPKESATTWHAFLKTQASQLEPILAASGRGGAFLTPKDLDSGTTSGQDRVIWLETTDLDKAMKVHRLYPELLGVIRGKLSLGLRVRAVDYSSMRKKLEPSWNSDGVSTDIVVTSRWVLAPLPPQADKKSINQMLQQLGWKAAPLKQIAANTWLIGSGPNDPPPVDTFIFAGVPVLITEQKLKKSTAEDEVVVAAPPAFKKAFEVHFAQRLPVHHLVSHHDAPMQPQSQPPRCLVSELREDLNSRLQELQVQMQQAVNVVNQRVDVIQSENATASMEASATFAQQEQRLGQLEMSVQNLSANVVTKVDLADALRSAMENQTRERSDRCWQRGHQTRPLPTKQRP